MVSLVFLLTYISHTRHIPVLPTTTSGIRGHDSSQEAYRIGDKVEGNYRGRNRWHPGRISRVRLDGTYDVDYNDGEKEDRVAVDCLRPMDDDGDRAYRSSSDRRPIRRDDPSLSPRVSSLYSNNYHTYTNSYPLVLPFLTTTLPHNSTLTTQLFLKTTLDSCRDDLMKLFVSATKSKRITAAKVGIIPARSAAFD